MLKDTTTGEHTNEAEIDFVKNDKIYFKKGQKLTYKFLHEVKDLVFQGFPQGYLNDITLSPIYSIRNTEYLGIRAQIALLNPPPSYRTKKIVKRVLIAKKGRYLNQNKLLQIVAELKELKELVEAHEAIRAIQMEKKKVAEEKLLQFQTSLGLFKQDFLGFIRTDENVEDEEFKTSLTLGKLTLEEIKQVYGLVRHTLGIGIV